MPPISVMYKNPSTMRETIRPIASMCVAIITEGRGCFPEPFFQSMQGTKLAMSDFIHQWSPLFLDQIRNRSLMARKTRDRYQRFEERKDIAHQEDQYISQVFTEATSETMCSIRQKQYEMVME